MSGFLMVSMASKNVDREGLFAAIRAAVAAVDGRLLTLHKFLTISKMSKRDVFRHFCRWNDALLAAGFDFERHNDPVADAEMLDDWGCIVRKLGRMPTHNEYKLHGKHSPTTVVRRFGRWSKVCDAFRNFARGSHQWDDVLALIPPEDAPDKAYRRQKRFPGGLRACRDTRRTGRFEGRPVCGPRIPLESLSHAPVNEAGVLFLFALMASKLGFVVESLKAGFPDCEAKRLTSPGQWQTVRIEFEYESRNFLQHHHDPNGCDFIICWEHNWPECPGNIEVIALSKHVDRLTAETSAIEQRKDQYGTDNKG